MPHRRCTFFVISPSSPHPQKLFLLISWKLRKKSVSLQREHKIAKIWQDTSTHSQTGRSKESSARNTAKTC